MALQQVAEVPKVLHSGEERVTNLFLIFKLIILKRLLETDHMPFLGQTHGERNDLIVTAYHLAERKVLICCFV